MGITQQIGASSLIKPGVIDNTAARPASPYEGQVIFQKDTDQLLVWNGTAWVIPNSPAQNPTGLEYVSSTTVGTGVSSVTVSSAFNSSYDAYKIIWSNGTMSADTHITLAIGNATTGYYAQLIYASYAGTTALANAPDNNNTKWTYAGGAGNLSVELLNPFLALFTELQARVRYLTVYGTTVGVLANSNSYTSFTIAPASGIMTGGTITVYGYRKA